MGNETLLVVPIKYAAWRGPLLSSAPWLECPAGGPEGSKVYSACSATGGSSGVG